MRIESFDKDKVSKKLIEQIYIIFSENEGVHVENAMDYANKVLILYDEDKMIGYCFYKYNLNLPYQGVYINQVALYKNYQNKGYGKLFYDYIEKSEQCNIYLHVNILNQQSMKFHCKNGFFPIKVESDGEYVNLLLVKEISKH